MAYEKQTWANGRAGGTPIDADALDHIEEGIEAAAEVADAAETPAGATAKAAAAQAAAIAAAETDATTKATAAQTAAATDATTKANAAQAAAVQRSNHTGTQPASTISDFDAAALAATTATYVAKVSLPYFASAPSGTDDLATLNTEATAAAAAGRPYRLLDAPASAPYKLSNTWTLPTGCHVSGSGATLTTVKPTAGFAAAAGSNPALLALTGDRQTVTDLGIIGDNADSERNIECIGATDALIERCYLAETKYDAGGGVYTGWGVFIGSVSRNVRVVNCLMENAGGNAVEINDSHYCVVDDCHIVGAGRNGVEIYDVTVQPIGNRVSRCHIESPLASGVATFGDLRSQIVDNQITGAGTYGIIVDDSEVRGSSYLATFSLIAGNVIDGANALAGGAHGLGLIGAKECKVEQNTVTNTASGGAAGNGCGLYLNGDGHNVEGNTFSLNTLHGIYLNSGTGTRIIANTCNDNSVGSVGAGDGIRVAGANTLVLGNTATDTRGTKRQQFGVFINGVADCIVAFNRVLGAQNLPIYDTGTKTFRIGNDVERNHLLSSGTRPNPSYGAAAGTGPGTFSGTGSDTAATMNFTTGTGTTTGVLMTIPFSQNFGTVPVGVSVTPMNAATKAARPYVSSVTASQLVISVEVAPAASTALSFSYIVIGHTS